MVKRAQCRREPLQEGRDHLTISGTFQSDRYPTVPAGKVPLSVRDPLAQDLLWEYARRHREAAKHGDSEFPKDLEDALRNAGFESTAGPGMPLPDPPAEVGKHEQGALEWPSSLSSDARTRIRMLESMSSAGQRRR